MRHTNLKFYKWLWGNNSFFGEFVEANGLFGGLMTYWKSCFFTVERIIKAERYILLVGFLTESKMRYGFGNTYAPNDDEERANFWEELLNVLSNWRVAWCLGGHFNVVRWSEEKIGVGFNVAAMDKFSDFIEHGELLDLPLVGGKFTWCSSMEELTFCRLNRFLISSEFLIKFPSLIQKLWPRSISNHFPMSIDVEAIN
ncbi:hypothetical protein PTKIN_Ptkin16aG0010200 [Pterospermum kingtungense]